MLDHANARLRRQRERQDFAGGNVSGVVRFGKLSQGKPAIGQADGGLGPGAAQW